MSTLLTSLAALVVVLGVLIFVHELGHFLAAKAVDIAVLRFSLGLGKPTKLSFTRGETEYCVSWIPFGGYVKMAGFEEEGAAGALEGPRSDAAAIAPERTFDKKPLWARVMVMLAGVTMNVLFAIVVYAGLAATYGIAVDSMVVRLVRVDSLPPGAEELRLVRAGDRIVAVDADSVASWPEFVEAVLSVNGAIHLRLEGQGQPLVLNVPRRDEAARIRMLEAIQLQIEPVIGEVVPGEPAAVAGIERGDRIIRIGSDSIPSWESLVGVLSASAGRPLDVTVLRGGRTVTLHVTPRSMAVQGDSGRMKQVGRIGVGVLRPIRRYRNPVGALRVGVRQSWGAARQFGTMLKGMFSGAVSPRELGGPILVGQVSGAVARQGVNAFLSFMALFSVNLAVLNLLPIPVLDGGNIVLLLLEGVLRRPVSLEVRYRIATVGLLLIVLLMLFATYNDVGRLLQKLF